MQDEYPADEGVRLRSVCDAGQAGAVSARLFLCAGCRGQVIICGCCDRGQIYCNGGDGCAARARRRTLQAAGRRYQASQRGRRRHAARMGRYRSRQKKVTHHGSPEPPASDLLAPVAMTAVRDDAPAAAGVRLPGPHCHWCGRGCPPLLRQGFLRRRRRHRVRVGHDRTEPGDHGDAA
jgi:hypothetical protein